MVRCQISSVTTNTDRTTATDLSIKDARAADMSTVIPPKVSFLGTFINAAELGGARPYGNALAGTGIPTIQNMRIVNGIGGIDNKW
jgi:hypothetical protein